MPAKPVSRDSVNACPKLREFNFICPTRVFQRPPNLPFSLVPMLLTHSNGGPNPNRHGGMCICALRSFTANNFKDDLRHFHAKHFPHAPVPEHYLQEVNNESQKEYYDEGDVDLGYYEDGVQRTLTDEQIAMFRHSEIQRILLERMRRKEAGEAIFEPPSPEVRVEDAPTIRPASPASDQSTPMSMSSDDEQRQSTQAERPKQKWTTTSEKTRARNAKNRKKNRKNHRERKKLERKQREQEEKEARRRAEREEILGEESDEWDPWHQANGPDAQKDDAVDLDY